jgi:hypothetical protein
MSTNTKTPRELLRETLDKNTREIAGWPEWMRNAISTASVFYVPAQRETEPAQEDARREGSAQNRSTAPA